MAAACLVAVATVSVLERRAADESPSSAMVLPMTPWGLTPSRHLNTLRQAPAACPIVIAQQCSIESQ
jgi:hypothetical protein